MRRRSLLDSSFNSASTSGVGFGGGGHMDGSWSGPCQSCGQSVQGRSIAFVCSVYVEQFRTHHPFAFLCAPHEALVIYSRAQRVAVLGAEWLTSMAVSAVFFGRQPFLVEVRLGVGLLSALAVLPAAVIFPTAFRRAATIVSRSKRGEPVPTVQAWYRAVHAARMVREADEKALSGRTAQVAPMPVALKSSVQPADATTGSHCSGGGVAVGVSVGVGAVAGRSSSAAQGASQAPGRWVHDSIETASDAASGLDISERHIHGFSQRDSGSVITPTSQAFTQQAIGVVVASSTPPSRSDGAPDTTDLRDVTEATRTPRDGSFEVGRQQAAAGASTGHPSGGLLVTHSAEAPRARGGIDGSGAPREVVRGVARRSGPAAPPPPPRPASTAELGSRGKEPQLPAEQGPLHRDSRPSFSSVGGELDDELDDNRNTVGRQLDALADASKLGGAVGVGSSSSFGRQDDPGTVPRRRPPPPPRPSGTMPEARERRQLELAVQSAQPAGGSADGPLLRVHRATADESSVVSHAPPTENGDVPLEGASRRLSAASPIRRAKAGRASLLSMKHAAVVVEFSPFFRGAPDVCGSSVRVATLFIGWCGVTLCCAAALLAVAVDGSHPGSATTPLLVLGVGIGVILLSVIAMCSNTAARRQAEAASALAHGFFLRTAARSEVKLVSGRRERAGRSGDAESQQAPGDAADAKQGGEDAVAPADPDGDESKRGGGSPASPTKKGKPGVAFALQQPPMLSDETEVTGEGETSPGGSTARHNSQVRRAEGLVAIEDLVAAAVASVDVAQEQAGFCGCLGGRWTSLSVVLLLLAIIMQGLLAALLVLVLKTPLAWEAFVVMASLEGVMLLVLLVVLGSLHCAARAALVTAREAQEERLQAAHRLREQVFEEVRKATRRRSVSRRSSAAGSRFSIASGIERLRRASGASTASRQRAPSEDASTPAAPRERRGSAPAGDILRAERRVLQLEGGEHATEKDTWGGGIYSVLRAPPKLPPLQPRARRPPMAKSQRVMRASVAWETSPSSSDSTQSDSDIGDEPAAPLMDGALGDAGNGSGSGSGSGGARGDTPSPDQTSPATRTRARPADESAARFDSKPVPAPPSPPQRHRAKDDESGTRGAATVQRGRMSFAADPSSASAAAMLAKQRAKRQRDKAARTIQSAWRGFAARRLAMRLQELRVWEGMHCERQAVVTLVYASLLLLMLGSSFVCLVFGVVFAPEQARAWVLTTLVAFLIDAAVQEPIAILINALVLIGLRACGRDTVFCHNLSPNFLPSSTPWFGM